MRLNELHIFLLDDDTYLLKALERIIKGLGHSVNTFSKKSVFFNWINHYANSCLIVDLGIFNISSSTAFHELKENKISLPVIFMTASDNSIEKQNALQNGAIDYLIKPFDAADLYTAIKKAAAFINEKN